MNDPKNHNFFWTMFFIILILGSMVFATHAFLSFQHTLRGIDNLPDVENHIPTIPNMDKPFPHLPKKNKMNNSPLQIDGLYPTQPR